MMPLTDMGAFSTSDSNHCSRKSTALMVSSLIIMSSASGPPRRISRPRRSSRISSRGLNEVGSGAGASMTLRVSCAIFVMVRLNSG